MGYICPDAFEVSPVSGLLSTFAEGEVGLRDGDAVDAVLQPLRLAAAGTAFALHVQACPPAGSGQSLESFPAPTPPKDGSLGIMLYFHTRAQLESFEAVNPEKERSMRTHSRVGLVGSSLNRTIVFPRSLFVQGRSVEA